MSFVDNNGLQKILSKIKTMIDKKQDATKTILISSSSSSYKNKWIKFATIDLSSAGAYVPCSGTLSFIRYENNSPVGTIRFNFRNGQTAGILQDKVIVWTSLNNSKYAYSVASVKVSDGKYDIYYQPKLDWETPYVSLTDSVNSKYFTFNTGSYVDNVTAESISHVESYASSAGSVQWEDVSGKPNTYNPSSHTHDDRYYTESEVDSKLSSKLNLSGGTMTGQLKWNASSLQQFSDSPNYLVGIDAFADGGTMKWQSVSSVKVGSATKADSADTVPIIGEAEINTMFTDIFG